MAFVLETLVVIPDVDVSVGTLALAAETLVEDSTMTIDVLAVVAGQIVWLGPTQSSPPRQKQVGPSPGTKLQQFSLGPQMLQSMVVGVSVGVSTLLMY